MFEEIMTNAIDNIMLNIYEIAILNKFTNNFKLKKEEEDELLFIILPKVKILGMLLER